jgi:hypothetical protein
VTQGRKKLKAAGKRKRLKAVDEELYTVGSDLAYSLPPTALPSTAFLSVDIR